jgi:hypothetical protein
MIISSILLLLLSNAVTLRRDKSILYSRISIIILLYSCLIACFSIDWCFLVNCIDLFTGFFLSTVVELQIIGLYLLYSIYRGRNLQYFYIFLLMGFFSCFSMFGCIGITTLFLLKSCCLTLYIILYNLIHVKSKNKKYNTCLQNIYLKLKDIIQKIIENFKYIGLMFLVSIAIKNSFFYMLNDFYCLQLIVFLAFSLWLPISYINSIFFMYKKKETVNFSLFNEYIINYITIDKAIFLICMATFFGYIKIVFLLDLFRPLLCDDSDDESVSNVSENSKNKDIVKYNPKKRLSTSDTQLSKDAINKDILKYNLKRRLSTSDTQLSEDVSNKIIKINPNLLITNRELDYLYSTDKKLADKYYTFNDNSYINVTDARTIITKNFKHIWVELPKFSGYTINNYMDKCPSAILAFNQLDSECLEDITYGYVSPLLNTVFKNEYGFGVVPQTGGGKSPCDFIVNIADDIRFHHTFIECKRFSGDSVEASMRQLVRYLKESNAPNNVFGIVVKDSFITFFEYHSGWHNINAFNNKCDHYVGLLGLYASEAGIKVIEQQDIFFPQFQTYNYRNPLHIPSINMLFMYLSQHAFAPWRGKNLEVDMSLRPDKFEVPFYNSEHLEYDRSILGYNYSSKTELRLHNGLIEKVPMEFPVKIVELTTENGDKIDLYKISHINQRKIWDILAEEGIKYNIKNAFSEQKNPINNLPRTEQAESSMVNKYGTSNISSQINTPEKNLHILKEVKQLPSRFNTSNSSNEYS